MNKKSSVKNTTKMASKGKGISSGKSSTKLGDVKKVESGKKAKKLGNVKKEMGKPAKKMMKETV